MPAAQAMRSMEHRCSRWPTEALGVLPLTALPPPVLCPTPTQAAPRPVTHSSRFASALLPARPRHLPPTSSHLVAPHGF